MMTIDGLFSSFSKPVNLDLPFRLKRFAIGYFICLLFDVVCLSLHKFGEELGMSTHISVARGVVHVLPTVLYLVVPSKIRMDVLTSSCHTSLCSVHLDQAWVVLREDVSFGSSNAMTDRCVIAVSRGSNLRSRVNFSCTCHFVSPRSNRHLKHLGYLPICSDPAKSLISTSP